MRRFNLPRTSYNLPNLAATVWKPFMEKHIDFAPLPAGGERALLLAIDDLALPLRNNLCIYLSKPAIRPEPVLLPESVDSNAPDNLAAHFYGTVLQDDGRFRMWYYACHWGLNLDWPPELKRQLVKSTGDLFMGPLCYAESDDGITWHKPALGQVLFKGSRENNAIALPHAIVACATLIKDEADPDPARRYKMIYEFFPENSDPPLEGIGEGPTCARAISADGITWTVLDTPYPLDFIEHSSFYKHDGKFIINSQNINMQIPGEGGTMRGRQGYARFSFDYDNWMPAYVESFLTPEPRDPSLRGINGTYDQVHLGVGATSFGNVCVGLYGLWHNNHFHEGFSRISCDLGLVISNDGLHFREPVKDHIFIAKEDSPASDLPGEKYNTNLCQANGIINVGDETRIYHGRWRNAEKIENYSACVALATLPRDRWGSLGLFHYVDTGFVYTAPVSLAAGCKLALNVDAASAITVEVTDEQCHPIAGLSGEDAGKVAGEGGLDCAVNWPGGSLDALSGQVVRFKVSLQRTDGNEPRLYAMMLER